MFMIIIFVKMEIIFPVFYFSIYSLQLVYCWKW